MTANPPAPASDRSRTPSSYRRPAPAVPRAAGRVFHPRPEEGRVDTNVADAAPVDQAGRRPSRWPAGLLAQTEIDLRLFGMLVALGAILIGSTS